ncbi:hypothetical protein KSW81_006511 [Nannochloris sp. 'desiccata']|nr:hypothetical protein KSW81_006511 [Chlorella desiccata (nom. nud.)]
METNEDFCEISLAATEDLGIDQLENADGGADQEGTLASVPEDSQPINLSTSDDESDTNDACLSDEESEHGSEEQEPDSPLNTEDIHLDIRVTRSHNINVAAASLRLFLKHSKLNLKSLPIPILITDNAGKVFTTRLGKKNRITGSYTGAMGNAVALRTKFGLKKGYGYKLVYRGSMVRTGSEEGAIQQKVYSFQVDDGSVSDGCVGEERDDYCSDGLSDEENQEPLYSGNTIHVSRDGREFVTTLCNPERFKLSGSGVIKNAMSMKNSLELKPDFSYKLMYRRYSTAPALKNDASLNGEKVFNFEEDASLGREKVYKFEINESGLPNGNADKESDIDELDNGIDAASVPSDSYTAPDWAEEATSRPLVPVQLPEGVPAFWDMIVGNTDRNNLRILADPCKVFMDQIGCRYKQGGELAVEFAIGETNRYYTSFYGLREFSSGVFRQGAGICKLAGFSSVGLVLRMRYLGHRLLDNGTKVYCLHAEKVRPDNTEENKEVLLTEKTQIKRKATDIKASRSTYRPVETRGARERGEEAKRIKTPLVSRKNAQLPSTNGDQKTSRKKKSMPERYEGAPDWVKNVVQGQYQRQHGEPGASGSKQQAASPQQQRQLQQQQVDSIAELADKVSEALLYHPGLDKNVVYRYLPIFARLSDKTRDIDGNFILKLASEPLGAGLQIFLEAALQHHQ